MRWAAALVVLAATAAFPATAAADDAKVAARSLFNQGVKLVEAGDAAGALGAFRAAYDRSPSFRVLFNIGQLCARLGDPVCAVRSYEQYLADGANEVGPRRRRDVEAELAKLRRDLGTVAVTVNRPGAEVTVDDAPAGRAPLAQPVLVTAGSHKVVASLEGRSADRTVRIASGEAASVDLVLVDPPPPPDPPRPVTSSGPPEPPPRPSPAPVADRRGVPVAPWLVAGGFAIATVISAVLAESRYNAFVDRRQSFPVTRADLDDAQGSARTLFLVTGALGAATVASAAVATYFTVTARSGGALRIGVGPATVAIGGQLP